MSHESLINTSGTHSDENTEAQKIENMELG